MHANIKTYQIKSPAKINIGLRVLSKRKDGYHNIETIFYPVKIYDDIKISIKDITSETVASNMKNEISVKVYSKNNTLNEELDDKSNICYKAVKLFLEKFKIKGCYRIGIGIKKNIPVGAGLGGGSSNAASVLKILTRYFKISHNDIFHGKSSLQKIALQLGSDVPFFLYRKAAYACGRGEKLVPLPKFKVYYKLLLVNPGIHVSTAWAYKQLGIKNYKLRIKEQSFKRERFRISDSKCLINDFEKIVFKKYPQIEKIKNDMNHYGAVFASMSGSGSTVYGFFPSEKIKAAIRKFSNSSFKKKIFII